MANYLLSNLNIDIISEEIGAFLDKCKVDRKDAMRIKLAAEEILLNYQECFGEEQKVALDCRKRFGRPLRSDYIRLKSAIRYSSAPPN